ncbi:hypothetical protein BC628DRAFT_1340003 [Trametes gibbosa]|nr:hypothetical protein BC628DRAFT_1340003 [Trametes gibbosa]
MRLFTLSAICATALIIPASAVPLATTTAVSLAMTTMNVVLKGPSELLNSGTPSLPLSGLQPAGAQKDQVHQLSKAKLPKSKLSRLPRGASFRQADYGVNHNVTLVRIPVQGVEAVPSAKAPSMPTPPRRRYYQDLEASDPDYAAASSSPSGDFSEAAASNAPATDEPSAPGSPAPPLSLGDLSKADSNHLPVHPNFSSASQLLGQSATKLEGERYKASYSTHDFLGELSSEAQPATAKTNGLSKSPAGLGKLPATPGPAHGLLGRMLQPARYITAPFRRAFSLAKGLGTHTLAVDTGSILPQRPDPTLNMSDPYVAQEEMRRQHTGLVNIDSNRAAPPPPAPPALPSGVPLNATSTAPTALKDGAGDAKNPTALPVDAAAKSPMDKAKKQAKKA